MGGIAGIISFTRGRADTRRVERMVDALHHRGPDDCGVKRLANGRMVMGGCRLLLNEADALASLPLANETDDIFLVLDGEIDNHRALRHSLRLDGHEFRTDLSAEVVVHAYEQYGLAFLEHLHGRFALALWDERRHRLVLARDRLGERPLYWTRIEGMLAFASEAKVLLDALPLPRRLDVDVLPEYLSYGFVLPPNTLLEGIRKLGAGEAVVIERGGRLQPMMWWAPCRDERRASAIRALSLEHHENNLRVLVDSAIADRLTANLSVAAMLDGSPESLAMSVAMGRLLGRTVDALVLSGEQARISGEWMGAAGIELTPVPASAARMAAFLPDYLQAMDEPIADPDAMGMWWLARAMSNGGLAVALAAAGAGTILVGESLLARYAKMSPSWRLLRRLPPLGRRLTARALAPLLRALGYGAGAEALRQAVANQPALPAGDHLFADPAQALGSEFKALARSRQPADALAGYVRPIPSWLAADGLDALSFMETRTVLAENQLVSLDRMAMAHSVELRLPFLDDALVDYALAIPSVERAPRGRPKDLLMRALQGLVPLPPNLSGAGERGQGAPGHAACWLAGEMITVFQDAVRRGGLFQRGLLDREACLGMLREFQSGRTEHYRRLWAILMLSEWFDRMGLEVPGLVFPEPQPQAAVG